MRETVQEAGSPSTSLTEKWQGLHAQAEELARLAAISAETFGMNLQAFPARIAKATEWQRELAWQGIEDIDAVMRPGLEALRTITARGQDTSAPALALWREFYAARNAVLAIAD